jgi:protein FrlC
VKLAYNTWALGSFPVWLPSYPLEEIVDRLAALGYEGVELGAAAPQAFPAYLDADDRERLLARARAHTVTYTALCPALGGGPGYNPASVLAAERAAAASYLTSCLDLAHDLECPRQIFLAGYRADGQSHTAAWELAVTALADTAAAAAERGVRLVVEPTGVDSNVCEDVRDALRLIDDAGVDAGVMLDTFHAFHRSEDFHDLVMSAGERLEYVHLSDRQRDAPGTHTDFTSIVASLREIGYDGWLTMEIGFDRRSVDPFGMARDAHEHVRSLLGGA